MTVSGVGAGAAFEGEECNARRLVKTRAALIIMIARFESSFMGGLLHYQSSPAVLQEN
jgi:hypothetical protein